MNITDYNTVNEDFIQKTSVLFGLVGIFGNSFGAGILSLKKFRRTLMFRYFFLILIFQIIQILMVFISQIIDKYGKFQICKISTYLFYLNYEFINSSIALNSLDRFFSLKKTLPNIAK